MLNSPFAFCPSASFCHLPSPSIILSLFEMSLKSAVFPFLCPLSRLAISFPLLSISLCLPFRFCPSLSRYSFPFLLSIFLCCQMLVVPFCLDLSLQLPPFMFALASFAYRFVRSLPTFLSLSVSHSLSLPLVFNPISLSHLYCRKAKAYLRT